LVLIARDTSLKLHILQSVFYHLAAGHHEASDRLYTRNLTAPMADGRSQTIEWLQMAIDDLDDFLQLFPDCSIGQQTKQRLQITIDATQPTTL
jgi:hypothetical protein